ncbi:MAG: gamma carbonic anhydrase family protein [Bacteroidetes bacterium HGW-Bacteroidetes-1]|jgi:carbonic anhydrase/acetyltransferase-like protein (isoleucine patch superfamily)|nr:MAG: gamma carbonic anhydrase family protein [Bacteroidetes bacterium HGW-Bacteroidetes-1]
MALIRSIKGKHPKFGKNCFKAENATIIGDVEMGDNCSIWYNTVVRGDVHYIRIGNNVNIQDGVVIHCTYKKAPVNIGDNVSIAHNAIIHGCTINDNVLIGMGAIIMDGAIVESNSIVAAGALVSKDTIVESGSVYAGVPAKRIKTIDKQLLEGEVMRISRSYTTYASWHDPDIEPIADI